LIQHDWPRTELQAEKNQVQSGQASSIKEGRITGSSSENRSKAAEELLNMTTSSLNEDVTMNSDDFMDTSIDANISINSEDYENYINGEDFKASDKCRDLEVSGLHLDDGQESDVKGEPSVDDILAKYSHLQNLGSVDTADLLDTSVVKTEKQNQVKPNQKQMQHEATELDLPVNPKIVESLNQANRNLATTKPVTPKSSKGAKERKTQTPRSRIIMTPKKLKGNAMNPLNQVNQPLMNGLPKVDPSEGKSESKSSNPKVKKQGPKGGKTPIRPENNAIFKSAQNQNTSVVGTQSPTATPNKIAFSSTSVQSQLGSPASGKKPVQVFKCDECDKILCNKYNLNKHKLIHERRRTSGTS